MVNACFVFTTCCVVFVQYCDHMCFYVIRSGWELYNVIVIIGFWVSVFVLFCVIVFIYACFRVGYGLYSSSVVMLYCVCLCVT